MMMNLQLRLSLSVFHIALFSLLFLNTSIAQVSYNAAASYSLRKTVSTYTGNAIQVRRDCDNATTNIGFTSCGTLDTTALRSFVLSGNPLSAITPSAQGAYSLRKLRCAYTGNAITVRRPCDNATRDIGFTSNGDLDTVALKTFVMASNPLSAIASSAAAAFSLRKLSCSYVGNAITVRRSSDNTTSNIGFTTNGDLDTTALKTFVGASNGFVTTWFDQSGNGRDATQTTAANQPRIINAGVIEKQNGVPALRFLGLSSGLATANFDAFDAAACFNGVAKVNANLTYNAIVSKTGAGGSNNIPAPLDFYNNQVIVGNGAAAAFFATSQNFNAAQAMGVWTMQSQLAGNKTAFLNSASILNSAAAATHVDVNRPLNIGARNDGVTGLDGWISEIVTFATLPSSTDRAFLEWTQGQYYNISGIALGTIPAGAPSAFVTTWYDQSGNNRHATQATPGSQPRIINAGIIEKNASNRPSIFFNSTYLKNAFFLTTQPVSTSCVWRARGLANPGGELFGWGDNGGGGRRYGAWFAFNSATQGRYGVENLGAGMVGSTLLNTNTWYISSQILPGTSLPALTQWINGASQAMTNLGTPAAMNITAGEFAIGTIPAANTQGHNGDIQELIYFSTALSATDRQYIEYGQSVYYGISGPTVPPTLPVTRPSAFITRWYDQSGNGRDATQPATGNQPKILNSGVMSLQNGKPAISLDGTSNWLIQSTMNITQPYSLNVIATRTANGGCCGGYQRLVNISSTGDAFGYLGVLAENYATFNGNGVATWNDIAACTPATGIALNSQAIMTMVSATGATGLIPSANGSALTLKNGTSVAGTGFLLGGAYSTNNTSQLWPGNLSEFHIFSSALSTTRRTLIETNQSAFYSITVSNSKYTPPTSSSYIYYVNGIGRESSTDSVAGTRSTFGLGISVSNTASGFLKDNGDYITAGMNCPISSGATSSNLSGGVAQRWINDWYINKTDVGNNNGLLSLFFDFSDNGVNLTPGVASNYMLLYRTSSAGTFSTVASTTVSVSGDRVLFLVDASNISSNNYYTIGTINTTASPLPIELVDFKCNLIDHKNIELKWITASESNSQYFSVERSANGIDYETVGYVNAAGNSLNTIYYSYTDKNALNDISYYRLKSVDFDGSYKYSDICSVVNQTGELSISVYPNPTNNSVTVDFKNADNVRSTDFSIMDVTGKRMTVSAIQLNNKYILDLSSLQSGLYFIELNISNKKVLQKIILQK